MEPKELKTYLRFNMSGTHLKKLKRPVVLLFIIQGSCSFFRTAWVHNIRIEKINSKAQIQRGGGGGKSTSTGMYLKTFCSLVFDTSTKYIYLLITLRVMTIFFMERSTISPLDL